MSAFSLWQAASFGTRIGKAIFGRRGDDAEQSLRAELHEIRSEFTPEQDAEVARLIKVAAEVLG